MPRKIPGRAQEIRDGALVFFLLVVLSSAAVAAEPGAVERGAYLAAAAGCEQCHTDSEHNGQRYAGGRRLPTEFGMITTPNLTPDPTTGIGRWSDADFIRAMRWGIAPDDSHYVPAFPYPFYNRLSERDLSDIKGFLSSLPPVPRPGLDGAGSTALLVRARATIAVLATPFPGPWQPDPQKDPVWNRGAYLVATIGRCGYCHTPRTLLGAPDADRFLAGTSAGPDGKKVPNITSESGTGIGNWSEDDIFWVLTDGHTPDFDFVGGAMAEIVKNTSRLSDEDRRAIAVYLKTVPAKSASEQK